MTCVICFLVFAHLRQNFGQVLGHNQQFYANYQTLYQGITKYSLFGFVIYYVDYQKGLIHTDVPI